MSNGQFSFVHDTTRYSPENAYWLGRAAQLAYRKKSAIQATVKSWGLDNFRFFDHGETQAFAAGDRNMIIIAFRGTEPSKLRDWCSDADCQLADGPFGKVHEGFYRALRQIWFELAATIAEFQDDAQSLWFTGHSLGAALAALAVATLREEQDKPVYGLYTFGQPRTGDRDFERVFNQDCKPRSFRFVNNNDIVTRVPLRVMGYSHVGTFLYFDAEGNLHDDPSWWYRFVDGTQGRVEDLGKMGPDEIKDHSMDTYVKRLAANRTVNPFAG